MEPVLALEGAPRVDKSPLDRALSLFTDVHAGEGLTAALMLVTIFLQLVCYSVIKTVREPLILLGGGAEVRSYTAAVQAVIFMGFVPLYSWFASRVNRAKLLVGVSLFFVLNIELFALAVAGRAPYVGVAFYIWVGIFNISLVAQFWSFANEIYPKEAGDRLFPLIMIGMTGGAPLGSFVAGRLFAVGFTPQIILQTSALLLLLIAALFLVVSWREGHRAGAQSAPLERGGGFALVLQNPYLHVVAILIVVLNTVNTTGEYMIARLLQAHAREMAIANPGFNQQAYIGAFAGAYQFWVNVTALILQAFVASRLVKYAGLRGALLALPFIALSGYAVVAAGAGFAVVRWIKTAENATDYSIMNTARQLLWLPTTPEEKYKAKQAIDSFYVRAGDVLSAVLVFAGTHLLGLGISGFGAANVVLTIVWVGIAALVLIRHHRLALPAVKAAAAAVLVMVIVAAPSSARAQDNRQEQYAAEQKEKAATLHPYEPNEIEQRLMRIQQALTGEPHFYPFIGSVYSGGWLAAGPGYRTRYHETGMFDVHGAWSLKNFKAVDTSLKLPDVAGGRARFEIAGNWLDAPAVAFYGVGDATAAESRAAYAYRRRSVTGAVTFVPARFVAAGATGEWLFLTTGSGGDESFERRFSSVDIWAVGADPAYVRTGVFAAFDWRESPGYTRSGGLYKVAWSDYHQANAGRYSFQRVDVEASHFIPVFRENWVIALRALASTTTTARGEVVPFFMLPDLGGSRNLRGYPSWRFRDRARALLTGEYRWMAGNFVDMVLFLDAGKVAPRLADIALNDLRTSYGIAVRFHTPAATAMRIELARTAEGLGLVFGFGPVF